MMWSAAGGLGGLPALFKGQERDPCGQPLHKTPLHIRGASLPRLKHSERSHKSLRPCLDHCRVEPDPLAFQRNGSRFNSRTFHAAVAERGERRPPGRPVQGQTRAFSTTRAARRERQLEDSDLSGAIVPEPRSVAYFALGPRLPQHFQRIIITVDRHSSASRKPTFVAFEPGL